MKNKVIFGILGIFLVTVIIGFSFESKRTQQTSCKTPDPEKIVSFNYFFGSFNEGRNEIYIRRENQKYFLVIQKPDSTEPEQKTEINSTEVENIQKIIEKYKVKDWNNFSEHDNNVSDGHGFRLDIQYNCSEIKAYGYMKYPKNYEQFQNEMEKIILKIRSQCYLPDC